MDTQNNPTPDAMRRLWEDFTSASRDLTVNRLAVGKLGRDLRLLYSERSNSADRRRSSGHGSFERELKDRGFKPNRIREMIVDYEVSIGLRPPGESTAAKRKARRPTTKAVLRDLTTLDPVAHFASLLPYSALRSAYRTALKELHPDCGGNEDRVKALIAAWEAVERLQEVNAVEGEWSEDTARVQ